MRFSTTLLLALPALAAANNVIFSNYASACQSCLDAVVSQCSSGDDATKALCFCSNSQFLLSARACGTGVCASDAAAAAKVPTDLVSACCQTVTWKGRSECLAQVGIPVPGLVSNPGNQQSPVPLAPRPLGATPIASPIAAQSLAPAQGSPSPVANAPSAPASASISPSRVPTPAPSSAAGAVSSAAGISSRGTTAAAASSSAVSGSRTSSPLTASTAGAAWVGANVGVAVGLGALALL